MDWQALTAALALVLILEGIGPFLSPRGMRRLYAQAAGCPDGLLRILGAVMIAIGLAVLTWTGHG